MTVDRGLAPETGAAGAREPSRPPVGRRLRQSLIQAALATLVLLLLQGAGGRLEKPAGLFDRAILAFQTSTAHLVAYDLGAGSRLPVEGAGFRGLERLLDRVWQALARGGEPDHRVATREGDLLLLRGTRETAWGRWQVTVLREDGAPWATVWVRATGTSPEGLHHQARQLVRGSGRLQPAAGRWLYVRLEGRYPTPLSGPARQVVGASLARTLGPDPSLRIHLTAVDQTTQLVIESAGPSPADLPLPTYAQAR